MVYRVGSSECRPQKSIYAWLHIFVFAYSIVLSKSKSSGISVVKVTISKMRENKDGIGPSNRQSKHDKDCRPTYFCGRISLATFVFHQMAHQVTAIGRSAFEDVIP